MKIRVLAFTAVFALFFIQIGRAQGSFILAGQASNMAVYDYTSPLQQDEALIIVGNTSIQQGDYGNYNLKIRSVATGFPNTFQSYQIIQGKIGDQDKVEIAVRPLTPNYTSTAKSFSENDTIFFQSPDYQWLKLDVQTIFVSKLRHENGVDTLFGEWPDTMPRYFAFRKKDAATGTFRHGYVKIGVTDSLVVSRVYLYRLAIQNGTTALNDLTQKAVEIDISPNPASDFFRIKLSKKAEKLTLLDALGRVVFQQQDVSEGIFFEIKTVGFPSGNYWLVAENEGEKTTKLVEIR